MSDQIQTYEPAPLGAPGGLPEPDLRDEPGGSGIENVLGIFKRRWRMVLLIWLVIALPGAALVRKMVQPTYTATAQVQVAPTLPAILYPDEKSQPMPFFDTFLNTQAELILSQQVLNAALADSRVQTLAFLKDEKDPQGYLRTHTKVTQIARSYLLKIEVTHPSSEGAILLTKSVLDAYMARIVGEETAQEQRKREILEKEREDLSRTQEQLSTEIRKLAQLSSAANDSWFEVKQRALEKNTLDIKQQYEAAELRISQFQEKLSRLDQAAATSMPADELSAQREQAIENDAAVRYLRQESDNAKSRYARLRSTLPEDRREVVEARAAAQRLQGQLDRERERAAAEVDEALAARQRLQIEQEKGRLQNDLAVEARTRDFLKQRLDELNQRAMDIGSQALAIQALRERNQRVKEDLERVNDGIKHLEIESRRPTRITVASLPEIRPDGIKDSRRKLTLAAILGGLLLAGATACLRDWRDVRLYDPQQLEESLGLPLLGSVPSLEELKDGRITKEDFLESYRVIRTTLAGMHPQNRPPKSILVTSAQAAEGKTSLAVSLAFSLAEPGSRVLLVDGDLQAPQIARLLRVTPGTDVKKVLLGQRSLREAVLKSTVTGVDVLAARPNGHTSGGLVHTAAAAHLVGQALSEYDHVVIDSPPCLGAADSLAWAQAVDCVILTSLVGHSDTAAIRMASQRLHAIGARISGLVIANVSVNERYYSTSVSYREPGPGGKPAAGRTPPVFHLPEPRQATGAAKEG